MSLKTIGRVVKQNFRKDGEMKPGVTKTSEYFFLIITCGSNTYINFTSIKTTAVLIFFLTNCEIQLVNIRTTVWMYGPNEMRFVPKA